MEFIGFIARLFMPFAQVLEPCELSLGFVLQFCSSFQRPLFWFFFRFAEAALYVYIIKHYQLGVAFKMYFGRQLLFWSVFVFALALNFALTLRLCSIQKIIINYNIINIFILSGPSTYDCL